LTNARPKCDLKHIFPNHAIFFKILPTFRSIFNQFQKSSDFNKLFWGFQNISGDWQGFPLLAKIMKIHQIFPNCAKFIERVRKRRFGLGFVN